MEYTFKEKILTLSVAVIFVIISVFGFKDDLTFIDIMLIILVVENNWFLFMLIKHFED